MDDLFLQEMQARRQRLLADALRKQALQEEYVGAPGRMIGNRYVAPSWAQSLNQGLKPFAANNAASQQEAVADAGDARLSQGLTQARKQWQQAMPQAVPANEGMMGPQAEYGSPELGVAPAQPVTAAQVLKHTMRGLEIPGNEKAAGLYNQSAQAELTREDTQAFRKQEAEATRAARLQERQETLAAQAEALRVRMESSTLDRVSREALARERNAIMASSAAVNAELRRMSIEMRAREQGRDAKADLKAEAAIDKDVTNLSKRMGPLNTTINAAQEVQNLLDAYRDPKTGLYKSIPGIGRETALPGWARSVGQQAGVMDKATNPNAAVVQRLLGDIMRQQAGLSQTISEQARVIATNLASGSYTQKEFIDNWGALQQSINNDLNNLQAGHSNEVLGRFKERGGKLDPVKSSTLDTPSAAEQATARQQPSSVSAKQARLEELRRKQAGGP
jgi:hypothetical protein